MKKSTAIRIGITNSILSTFSIGIGLFMRYIPIIIISVIIDIILMIIFSFLYCTNNMKNN